MTQTTEELRDRSRQFRNAPYWTMAADAAGARFAVKFPGNSGGPREAFWTVLTPRTWDRVGSTGMALTDLEMIDEESAEDARQQLREVMWILLRGFLGFASDTEEQR